MNRVQSGRVVKNIKLRTIDENTLNINNRIKYYKDNFKKLNQYHEWDRYDQEVKFDLMDLLEEMRHEFHISGLIGQQEEYRKINPEIMSLYEELVNIIYF